MEMEDFRKLLLSRHSSEINEGRSIQQKLRHQNHIIDLVTKYLLKFSSQYGIDGEAFEQILFVAAEHVISLNMPVWKTYTRLVVLDRVKKYRSFKMERARTKKDGRLNRMIAGAYNGINPNGWLEAKDSLSPEETDLALGVNNYQLLKKEKNILFQYVCERAKVVLSVN